MGHQSNGQTFDLSALGTVLPPAFRSLGNQQQSDGVGSTYTLPFYPPSAPQQYSSRWPPEYAANQAVRPHIPFGQQPIQTQMAPTVSPLAGVSPHQCGFTIVRCATKHTKQANMRANSPTPTHRRRSIRQHNKFRLAKRSALQAEAVRARFVVRNSCEYLLFPNTLLLPFCILIIMSLHQTADFFGEKHCRIVCYLFQTVWTSTARTSVTI